MSTDTEDDVRFITVSLLSQQFHTNICGSNVDACNVPSAVKRASSLHMVMCSWCSSSFGGLTVFWRSISANKVLTARRTYIARSVLIPRLINDDTERDMLELLKEDTSPF